MRKLSDEEPETTNSSEKSASISDQPEFSALEQSKTDEEETTTIIDDIPNVFNNVKNITEYNNNDSNTSTLEPAVESEQHSGKRVILGEQVDGLLQNKSADINLTTII